MANPGGGGLPKHVADYLKECGVDPATLPADVLATYATLTPGEVKALKKTGDVLTHSGLDRETIARIH